MRTIRTVAIKDTANYRRFSATVRLEAQGLPFGYNMI